jgi:hypothetical protein
MSFHNLPLWLVDTIRKSPKTKVQEAFYRWGRLEETGGASWSGERVDDESDAFFPLVEAMRARRFDTALWLLETRHPNPLSKDEALALLVAEDPSDWEEVTWSGSKVRAFLEFFKAIVPTSLARHPDAFSMGRFAARLPDAINALPLLFERGLSPDAHDEDGDTNLLMVAIERGHPAQLGHLLSAGADPGWKDPFGNTALHELWTVFTDYPPERGKSLYLCFFDQLVRAGASEDAHNMNNHRPDEYHHRKIMVSEDTSSSRKIPESKKRMFLEEVVPVRDARRLQETTPGSGFQPDRRLRL